MPPAGSPDLAGGCLKVVAGEPERDTGAEQGPVGTWLPVRHPDAAGVDQPVTAGLAVELHVGVAADHGVFAHAGERCVKVALTAGRQDYLLVAARGRVAEQHGSQIVDVERERRGERGEVVALGAGQLGAGPDVVFVGGSGVEVPSKASTIPRSALPRTQ